MSTVVVRPRSSAMSSCVPARCPAHRMGGGWGWRCSSAAGWPPGRGHGERPCRLRRHRPAPVVEVPADAAQIVDVLATMALACAAAG